MIGFGIIGKKIGMTRVFDVNGRSIPITVLDVFNNKITQVKTIENDGYNAIQVAFGINKSFVNKSMSGHLIKAKISECEILREFRLNNDDIKSCFIGKTIDLNIFNVGQKVDVHGLSIGKGYSGTIKRYNFKSGRASHGNSKSHNVPGSIGMAQDPGRVFPGKKMSGRLGNKMVTIHNLEIIRIDFKRSFLLLKGSVPGSKNNKLCITKAIKCVLK